MSYKIYVQIFSKGLKLQRWYPFHLPPPPPSPSPSPPLNFVPTHPSRTPPSPRSRFKVILFQEKLTIDGIRLIFDSLARSIGHLHFIGRIHGDIKPLNIVRTFDDRIMLIDLDMAVALREPVGAKQLSTAFVGPESTYQTVDADGGPAAEFRKADAYANGVAKLPLKAPSGAAYGGGDGYASDGLLLADPAFDIWAYGVVLYYAVAHKPLLETTGADQLRGKAERLKLARWSTKDLASAINDLDHGECVREGIIANLLLPPPTAPRRRPVPLHSRLKPSPHPPAQQPQPC